MALSRAKVQWVPLNSIKSNPLSNKAYLDLYFLLGLASNCTQSQIPSTYACFSSAFIHFPQGSNETVGKSHNVKESEKQFPDLLVYPVLHQPRPSLHRSFAEIRWFVLHVILPTNQSTTNWTHSDQMSNHRTAALQRNNSVTLTRVRDLILLCTGDPPGCFQLKHLLKQFCTARQACFPITNYLTDVSNIRRVSFPSKSTRKMT